MTEELPEYPRSYRSLGLIANPFCLRAGSGAEAYPGTGLIMHGAANRLIAAVDVAAGEADSRPIWVEKAGSLPASYYVGPLAETLGALGQDDFDTSVIVGYVPLDMMRLGRVRAALGVIAERVAGTRVDLTIASWAQGVLADPDTSLPEWEAVAPSDLAALSAALAEDPAATIERYFGPCVAEREGADDLETLMRVSTTRQTALEADPDEAAEPADTAAEGASGSEEAPEGPLSEAFTVPLGPLTGTPELEEAEEEPEPEDGLPRSDALVDYLVAHARAHLSPVIARGLRAYRAQGTSSMSQELKISKAPTKTLAALCRFAETRFRRVVLVYDRFDMWPSAPDDLKMRIVSTFSQLRFALRGLAVLVFVVSTGQAPEVEEQFAGATRVTWDLPGLAEVEGDDPAWDGTVAQSWLEAATVPGRDVIVLGESPLADLIELGEGSLVRTAALLAEAVDDAARRGVDTIDEEAVLAARSLTLVSD